MISPTAAEYIANLIAVQGIQRRITREQLEDLYKLGYNEGRLAAFEESVEIVTRKVPAQ